MRYRFGECVFDLQDHILYRAGHAIPLRPKAFALLHYLVRHAQRTVPKEELYAHVWPQQFISDATLESTVRAVRQAIGDNGRAQRLIHTVYGYGYRFIGAVEEWRESPCNAGGVDHASVAPVEASAPTATPSPPPPPPLLVGREAELVRLHSWLEQVQRGTQRVVFITGELGIGKTTVVDAFLEQAAAAGELWLARGQCIEHYGAGEAYLPVLDALERLCQEPGGEHLLTLLRQHAPTWLVHMPALLSTTELAALQPTVVSTIQERMLRELAKAIEV